jgi:hypothetical protein
MIIEQNIKLALDDSIRTLEIWKSNRVDLAKLTSDFKSLLKFNLINSICTSDPAEKTSLVRIFNIDVEFDSNLNLKSIIVVETRSAYTDRDKETVSQIKKLLNFTKSDITALTFYSIKNINF